MPTTHLLVDNLISFAKSLLKKNPFSVSMKACLLDSLRMACVNCGTASSSPLPHCVPCFVWFVGGGRSFLLCFYLFVFAFQPNFQI